MTTCLSVLRFASPPETTSTIGDDDRPSSLPFQRLTDRLIEHFSATSSGETKNSNVIQISNRYFTANVALLSEDEAHPTTTTDTPHKEDGIVLVWYDDLPQDVTHVLNSVHDQVEASGGGDLLRLCVGVVASTSTRLQRTPKELEDEYSKRVLWCLDRGYEYIHSCDLSDEGVERGHGDRDKEGFARLVEAIQGTVWSSAVMATTTQQTLKSSYGETVLAVVETSDENNENDDDRMNQYVPPDPTMLQVTIGKEDIDREKQAQEALMKEIDEVGHQTISSTVEEGSNDEVAHGGDLTSERLLNQFEGAIQEASRIRDMSRSGQLSDEERRQRAGDAALMLVNLLDRMGYDDDDDEDEQDGESSDGDEGKEEKAD